MDSRNRITMMEDAEIDYCPACMEKVSDADICPYCGSIMSRKNSNELLPVGYCLHERYLIGLVKGTGGFGTVYLAFDQRLLRKVAVKEYYPYGKAIRDAGSYVAVSDFSKKKDFEKGKELFLSESRAMAKFHDCPAVIDVIDTFEENGTAYIIMEYLEGKSIEQYVEQEGTLSFQRAYEMLKPVFGGLKEIHRQGMIHRDLSPQNIMILNDGRIKLMDFGISGEFYSTANIEEAVKSGYSPLEQYGKQYGPQGPWTDVYSISAVLYYMLTGRAPDDSLKRKSGISLEKPSKTGADIQSHAEKAILKGLELSYEDRYQSVRELETAFDGKGINRKSIFVTIGAAVLGAAVLFLGGRYLLTDKGKPLFVYHDYMAEENHFPERIRMSGNDMSLVNSMDETHKDSPYSGTTCIRCELETKTGDWGGWMFVNSITPEVDSIPMPADGSMDGQGIDLSSARKLIFYAKGEKGGERAEFFVSGFGYDEWGKPVVSFPDSNKKKTLGFITLTDTWQEYSIDLKGMDLTNTICGFGYAMNAEESQEGLSVFYLDEIFFQ